MESRPRITLPPKDPAFESDDYRRAIDFLDTTYPPSVIKLGLERITRLLDLLSRPQDSFPSIIVAGTNGKGSTCAFLESILSEAGLVVGTNLSPHLEQPTERIRVRCNDMSPEDFASIVLNLADLVENSWGEGEKPTYHEFLTAVALVHFDRSRVDVAILEVGLGGRYDSANAVDAPLAVITPIGLDHTDRLGNDLASIAKEKAAVVRPGTTVICASQAPGAMVGIDGTFETVRPASVIQPSGKIRIHFENWKFFADMHIDNFEMIRIPLGIGGARSADNARLAVVTAMALHDIGLPEGIDYDVNPDVIMDGLSKARLPGRFEIVGHNPPIVVDGAHNQPGAICLAETLAMIPGVRWRAIIGIKADKDAESFFRGISKAFDATYLCQIPDIKSYKPEALARLAKRAGIEKQKIYVLDNPREAFAKVLNDAGNNDAVLITGSLYLVGYMREMLRGFDESARQG